MVDYRYAADGRKLQEKVIQGSSETYRDYIGEFIYENGTLKKILFDGGYVDMIGDTPVYMFFIKDHLGSVRAVVSETGAVQQTNDYYPFGDLFGNSGTSGTSDSSDNRYRFTGKELGNETGLYDFSARYLQTSLGRFTTIDPLAEKYPNISPYAYCNGNPVRYIDPNGMDIYVFNNGTYSHVIKEDDKHRIANITYDSKGNAKTSYYKFADPINDPSGIDSGEIRQLQFVDHQTIIEMLNNQDAFNYPDIELKQFAQMSNSTNTEYSNSFDYAASELTSRYKADVGPDNLITSPYLFISKGIQWHIS